MMPPFKPFLLAALFFFGFATAVKAQTFSVYLVDPDPSTNVRNAPRGKVVDRIYSDSIPMLEVKNPRNGWWQIDGGCYDTMNGYEVDLKGSTTGYWIHHSVIGVGSRNYGGEHLPLRQAPSKSASVVYTLRQESILHPLDLQGDWVKVKTPDGHIGWIESEWLCSNPVTNCC